MSKADASVHRKGLEASFKILERWKASNVQILSILGLSNPIDQTLSSGQFSTEQITRISYILNIHAALRTVNKAAPPRAANPFAESPEVFPTNAAKVASSLRR